MEVGQEIDPDPENVIVWQVQDVDLTVLENVNTEVITEITIENIENTEKEVGQENGNLENKGNHEIIDVKKNTMTMEAEGNLQGANTNTVPEILDRDGKQVIPDLKEETIWNAEVLELATKIENLVKDQDIDRKKSPYNNHVEKSLTILLSSSQLLFFFSILKKPISVFFSFLF